METQTCSLLKRNGSNSINFENYLLVVQIMRDNSSIHYQEYVGFKLVETWER